MKKQLLLTAHLLLFTVLASNAQWATDPTVNNVVTNTANNSQETPEIVSDGASGAIIAWRDTRDDLGWSLYVQRLDANGNALWMTDGIAIGIDVNYYSLVPQIIADGNGGAIIAWQDGRYGADDVYVQRINANGVLQWTTGGVSLCYVPGHQQYPVLVSDGAGGAIVAWQDRRTGNNDVYAQRVDANGVVQWTTNGVPVCTSLNWQENIQLISDDAGGAIITWHDNRSGPTTDIYAQRINGSGVSQWTPNGVAICTATANQKYPELTTDGAGGAIIVWRDLRVFNNIYVQRINASGVVQWAVDGVQLGVGGDPFPKVVSDGAGGAIATWDGGTSSSFDIYAQRVNANGALQWAAGGLPVCTTERNQFFPELVADGSGGAIITWYDNRVPDNYDVYAQKVNAVGAVQWTADGIAIGTAAGDQVYPHLVSNSLGGAIITWQDYRSLTTFDLYAQSVCAAGALGNCGTAGLSDHERALVSLYPNPATNAITIQTETAGGTYQLNDVTGKVLQTGTINTTTFNLDISTLSKGVYFFRLTNGSQQSYNKIIKE